MLLDVCVCECTCKYIYIYAYICVLIYIYIQDWHIYLRGGGEGAVPVCLKAVPLFVVKPCQLLYLGIRLRCNGTLLQCITVRVWASVHKKREMIIEQETSQNYIYIESWVFKMQNCINSESRNEQVSIAIISITLLYSAFSKLMKWLQVLFRNRWERRFASVVKRFFTTLRTEASRSLVEEGVLAR